MREFVIGKNDANQRVDKFVRKAVPDLPAGLMNKYIRLKRIKLNGKRCEISTRLNEGDVMQLYISDEYFRDSKPQGYLAAPNEINVVYEDENILLVNKPSGLVVHEDDENTQDTLINRVLHYLYDKGEYTPETENSFVPALCNRLDRNTEGIVVCAKNAESLRLLNLIIKERLVHKKYLCITYGVPQPKQAEIKAYLEKNEAQNRVYVTDKKTPNNKTIVTKYLTLKTKDNLALCEVELVTGRTHQIRAHMAYIGCPLLGDGKYGSNEVNRSYHIKSQALCSYYLQFDFDRDMGLLNYLNKKSFSIDAPWFAKEFFDK